ncbi:Methyltransferase-like protein 7A [Amphibalanus amphitrite]|uniref:Methyltransferase-like protein 7A n=1 Tax=Amphibalanus amphitrite TaxID=1232801 RepID=A0A6A4VLT2_AMPAM|nr:Methyltransferase-like protein 7A [Amphibalanus amphitrite]
MLCLISCVLNYMAWVVGWVTLVVVTLKVVLGPVYFESLRGRAFAYFMEYLAKEELRKSLQQSKIDLFSSMKLIKSSDQELSKKNALNILEIGVGTGMNLEFYPAGSRLHCVDPNQAFEVYFRRECLQKAAHLDPDIRFVAERGESMPSVADSSVDVVVTTLVMCSVTHLDQMLREIRRVLVPGGKFYFLEHVGHPSGTWRRRLQNVLSNSGFWPAVFDGCVLNREVEEVMQTGGFSQVDCRSGLLLDTQMQPTSAPLSGAALVNPFVYGELTK